MAGGTAYTLVHDYKNGWNPEMFRERYSEVLERYDFVVGDWGYNQLRLKGFFRAPQPKSSKDAIITSLIDYINEYCNFGCAYFVLEKLDPSAIPEDAVIHTAPVEAPPEKASEGVEAAPADDGEPGEAPAATAAAPVPGAPLLRWPLKERPGGRVPGTSPSAVARAVSEGAERRAAAAAQANGSRSDSSFGRSGYSDGGYGGGRSKSGGSDSHGRDRRSGGGGQGNHSHGGHSHGGSRHGSGQGGGSDRRPHGQDRKQHGSGGGGHSQGQGQGQGQRQRHSQGGPHSPSPVSAGKETNERHNGVEARASVAAGTEGDSRSPGGGGGRWAGKNRRRGGFHGKPNRPRPDGAPRGGGAPRSDAGTGSSSGHSGGERS
ncbi:YutD family protein [Cohnella fermenti]|uniref:DUF1027 domain-containing protein n=1 Tax=Cohnella fermenti TaxID=2565925 RepID=A0A4S4C4Q3_9BACL|nr:YutD family protein [Cohnella fermenti]THF82765.1 DUF1027 domain-containing protein [Cohnella fermenti]